MDCKKKKRHLIHHRIKLAGRNSLRRSFRKSMSSKAKKAARCSASSFWNAGLRANNRSLAQALQEMRIQFGLAHQQNLKYQHEIQILRQTMNELHQNKFPHMAVERKIQKYKNAFVQMEIGLNNVGDKLIEAVDILSNLVQSSHEAVESIDSASDKNMGGYQTEDKSEITALQQCDKPRLLNDAVKASVLNMSIIMEQSGMLEEENSTEEILEEQKDTFSAEKHKKCSFTPPILSPKLEPSPLTTGKTFLEREEENLDSGSRASENIVPVSKPAYQSGNVKLITPKVKKIIDLSVTPPSPVLNIDFDAELKKFNSKYNGLEVGCSTPPSGKSSSSRRGTYILKESKPTSSYPISPGNKKTSIQIELFPQGITSVAQQKILPSTEIDGNISPENALFANNSDMSTNKRISDEIEPNSKSSSYMDLSNSAVDHQNGVDITNDFSSGQQNDHSKPLFSFNKTENDSFLLNDVEVASVEFTKLNNKGPGETINSQSCLKRSYLCSIKEEDSILDPKECQLSNKKRPIRDAGKPKRVKKIKKQKHQKEMNNETDFVQNASEMVINKENVDFDGVVRSKHIHHVDFNTNKKAENLSAEEKLYSSTPEGYERKRRALTPSNKKRKRINNSSKNCNFMSEKEPSLPVAKVSFSKIDVGVCFMNNNETKLKDRESSFSSCNRNSSISSKETKPSLSNPSTPAVLENASFNDSAIDGSERRPRRARAQVSSYKLLPLNSKLRRPGHLMRDEVQTMGGLS